MRAVKALAKLYEPLIFGVWNRPELREPIHVDSSDSFPTDTGEVRAISLQPTLNLVY